MKTKTNLLPHQEQAYNKLSKLKVGALYMEMGTGKTRTAIELINKRLVQGKVTQVLWFCPCTVKKNLEKDIEKHSPDLLPLTKIVGLESISMSDKVYLETLKYLQKGKTFLIVDESNLVKNPMAMRTKRVYAISKLCDYKLILNGTPITRNEADLYSQWLILDPRIFGYRSYYSFAQNHLELDERGRIRRVLNVDYLTDKIAPYSFQISKDECLNLPRKIHSNRWFDITNEQNKHYSYVLEEITFLYSEWDDLALFNLFTALQLVTSGRRLKIYKDGTFTHAPFFESYKDNPRIETLDILLEQIWDKQIIICLLYTSPSPRDS